MNGGVVINEALKQARFSGSATGRREAWPDFPAKDSAKKLIAAGATAFHESLDWNL